MAKLIVVDGSDFGNEYDLTVGDERAPFIIGRDPRATISLSDNAISREHCKLEVTHRGIHLSDLRSRNRTYVNGDPIDEHRVFLLMRIRRASGPSEIQSIGWAQASSFLPRREEGAYTRGLSALFLWVGRRGGVGPSRAPARRGPSGGGKPRPYEEPTASNVTRH